MGIVLHLKNNKGIRRRSVQRYEGRESIKRIVVSKDNRLGLEEYLS